jgi:hypothetical protein
MPSSHSLAPMGSDRVADIHDENGGKDGHT